MAFDFVVGPSAEIVLSTSSKKDADSFAKKIQEHFIPNKILLFYPCGDSETAKELLGLTSFVKDQVPLNGKPTVYICENHVCKLPVTKLDDLKKLLVPQK